MTPTNVLLDALANLLASDSGTLAPGALAVHIHLAKANFTPGPGLVVADFTEADFTGYTPLSAGLGTQQFFVESSTQTRIIQLLEPAGGWHWEATALALLPQTMFGFYVTNNADTVLYGSQLLSPAVLIQAINDGVDLANVRFRMPPGVIT